MRGCRRGRGGWRRRAIPMLEWRQLQIIVARPQQRIERVRLGQCRRRDRRRGRRRGAVMLMRAVDVSRLERWQCKALVDDGSARYGFEGDDRPHRLLAVIDRAEVRSRLRTPRDPDLLVSIRDRCGDVWWGRVGRRGGGGVW